jgi:hypothetical protein
LKIKEHIFLFVLFKGGCTYVFPENIREKDVRKTEAERHNFIILTLLVFNGNGDLKALEKPQLEATGIFKKEIFCTPSRKNSSYFALSVNTNINGKQSN